MLILLTVVTMVLFCVYRVNVDGEPQPTDSSASSPVNDMGKKGLN